MCHCNLRSSFHHLVVIVSLLSSINFCVSAPAPSAYVGSIQVVNVPSSIVLNKKVDGVTSEIKASLDLILYLTASGTDKALSRRVTDAVVVLKQALQNPNPILREAVTNSLILVEEQEDYNNNNGADNDDEDNENEEGPLSMSELKLFLENLKDQVSVASFPPAFSMWMNNHIVVIQNFVKDTTQMTTTTMTTPPSTPPPIILGWAHHHHHRNQEAVNQLDDETVKKKFQKFKSFIQDGLKSSVVRPETLNNIEYGKVNNLMESGELDTALASILIDSDEDNLAGLSSSTHKTDNNEGESSQYSSNFLQAIKDVYNRATPDLHQPILSVLRALEKNGRRRYHHRNDEQQRGSPNSILYKNSVSQGL